MQWPTVLTAIQVEPFFNDELKTDAQELNSRISEAQTHRAKIEQDARRLKDMDPGAMTAKDVSALKEIATREFRELGSESPLFEALDVFYENLQLAVQKEAAAAYQQHEEAKTEVRKRLVGIGYVDADVTLRIPGTILPGFLFAHPDVVAAKRRFDGLNSRVGGHPRSFLPDWERTQARLAELRDAM